MAAQGGQLDRLTPKQGLAVTLAERLTETPSHLDNALYADLEAAFGAAGLVELSSAIAWKNYLARFNRVFEVEASHYSDEASADQPEPMGRA